MGGVNENAKITHRRRPKMQDKIIKSLKPFQVLFYRKFRKNSQEAVEMLLMLACGHIFEIFTPNQLAQTLKIDKNRVYREIDSWSIFQFRKMFVFMGSQEAVKLVKGVLCKSPSTLSRMRITICVDDTVIDRLGKLISLTYSWYSGRHKKVVKGQNIIAITIKIGNRIIPLCIRPVSKQGRSNTSKPEIFTDMIQEVIDFFGKEGIDLTQFPITFDSWYGSKDLADMLEEEGFNQILVHAKSNYVFTIDAKKEKLFIHKKKMNLHDGLWGCKGMEVTRKAAESPTFGKVILLFFRDLTKVKCIISLGRKLRGCEIISIWKQHYSIEKFWRSLKHDLQIHRMRLRGRKGVYGMIGIKLLAYLVMERLSALTRLTSHQIKLHAKREIDLCSFFDEHFHLPGPSEPLCCLAPTRK
jgi:hypothetical protein